MFAGTSKKNLHEVVEIILHELEAMKQGLDPETLETVKHKTIGLFVLGSESNGQRMHHLGVSTLRHSKPRTIEEVVSGLEAVSNEDIQRLAEAMFDTKKISITALGVSEAEAGSIESLIN